MLDTIKHKLHFMWQPKCGVIVPENRVGFRCTSKVAKVTCRRCLNTSVYLDAVIWQTLPVRESQTI